MSIFQTSPTTLGDFIDRLYFALIASTGSNLEAVKAGAIPLINPITDEIIIPVRILFKLSAMSKSSRVDAAKANRNINSSPINPPITERSTASNKN